jgi:hypothetical protein
MGVRDGRKLSKEEVAGLGTLGRGSAALTDYYTVWNDLEIGEGHTYETEGKGITERSRWASVAKATGFGFQFSARKTTPRGVESEEITCTVIKTAPESEGRPTSSTGGRRRSSQD